MTIYITSDLHFLHDQDFLYTPRGFDSIWEHDRAVIENWNDYVSPVDEVYFLGDFCMGRDMSYAKKCICSLNGTIHWVRGNHDTDNRWNEIGQLPHIVQEGYGATLKHQGYRFFLSHFPTLTAPIGGKPLKRSLINLCGHVHTQDPWYDWDKGYIYHCEWDAHNRPISIDEIINSLCERA